MRRVVWHILAEINKKKFFFDDPEEPDFVDYFEERIIYVEVTGRTLGSRDLAPAVQSLYGIHYGKFPFRKGKSTEVAH